MIFSLGMADNQDIFIQIHIKIGEKFDGKNESR